MSSEFAIRPAASDSSDATHRAPRLAELLEERGKPVLTAFDFFELVRRAYRDPPVGASRPRRGAPDRGDDRRLKLALRKEGVIGDDRDYGGRVVRVLTVPDLPAEDVVCLVDPTCHVSHLSAMQRWGLTDRNPNALTLTRPDRGTAAARLRSRMDIAAAPEGAAANPFPLKIVGHPPRVRRRTVRIHESKTAGAFVESRDGDARLSAIGQTFLDTLQRPDLCGGMSHVLDVWEEHAETYLDEVVAAVDASASGLVKSRAGYVLDERLGLRHPGIERWKAFGQRGGSRKLDPAGEFAEAHSETWMLSLNV